MIINDLNLGVDTGELVSLVGPNGAGKSTTLRAITGLVAWESEHQAPVHRRRHLPGGHGGPSMGSDRPDPGP